MCRYILRFSILSYLPSCISIHRLTLSFSVSHHRCAHTPPPARDGATPDTIQAIMPTTVQQPYHPHPCAPSITSSCTSMTYRISQSGEFPPIAVTAQAAFSRTSHQHQHIQIFTSQNGTRQYSL